MDLFLRQVVTWSEHEAQRVHLVAPRPAEWAERFSTHRAMIQGTCPDCTTDHIGSTAIPGIWSKDVVDVLVGVPAGAVPPVTDALERTGYTCEGQRPGHAWLCWPAPERREAVIHVIERGSEAHEKRLRFRDRLRESPELAAEYEALKLALAEESADWGEYTARKAAFVANVVSATP